MNENYQKHLEQMYENFNKRDISAVLLAMTPDVNWPNGWEGGYVKGHDEVRNYWTRQWKEINPIVKPIAFKHLGDDQIEVEVNQLVKDRAGKVLFDGSILHIYTFEKGLVKSMEIKQSEKRESFTRRQ